MNIICIIFARGNSKGLKNKNLLKFKSTTLLGNSIRQAQKSKLISRIFVSTDSKKILREAIKNKAEVPFMRPKKLASDNSPEIDSWRHGVKFLDKNLKIKADYIVTVPATAPLRSVSDINKCISKAVRKKLDMVFCVTPSLRNPYFNILEEKNNKLDIFSRKKKKLFFRRQDAPKCYDLTTVCYVFKPNYINKTNNLFSGKVGFIKIPKERAMDIDDHWDYKVAKLLSEQK
tara:strand:+ start:2415 stop:3107 length:693 start_codon:yes stop_codon:yes gene_type:complete